MRRIFRKHPKVKVSRRIGRGDIQIGLGGGPGYSILPTNTVYLEGATEEDIIQVLVHELNRWAVFAFLTEDEVLTAWMASLNWMLERAPHPIIERAAGIPWRRRSYEGNIRRTS